MNDVGFASWVLVVFLFGSMCLCSYELGSHVTQVIFRLRSPDRRTSYEKWGVVSDLFRPVSTLWFTVVGIFFVFATFFFGLLAFGSTALLIEETLPTRDQLYQTLTFAMYALFLGLMVESERIKKITDKTTKLDYLRAVYHERFKVSELLSMYECLKTAPPLFWDEYTKLSDEEISEDTNWSYRVRANPYSNLQSGTYTRVIIVVGVLTLLLTGASAAIQLFA